jgi:hypothetical protein
MTDIASENFMEIFDPCVNRTLELIDGQVEAVMQRHGVKPKVGLRSITSRRKLTDQQMILVVGGFGMNQYLFNKITEYARARGIFTRQPQHPSVPCMIFFPFEVS